MMPTSGLGIREMEANFRERALEQNLFVSCVLCPWTARGTARLVMQEQREHRESHGLTRQPRHRIKRGLSLRQPELTDEERTEIDVEIARRKRLHGLDV